jgi:hypothetical protein
LLGEIRVRDSGRIHARILLPAEDRFVRFNSDLPVASDAILIGFQTQFRRSYPVLIRLKMYSSYPKLYYNPK